MSNLLTIIKYDFLGIINKFSKNKNKMVITILLSIALIFLICFQFIIQSLISLDTLKGTGYEYAIFISPLLVWFSFSLLFIMTNSVITNEKNTDFLLSLPIKKFEIISAKSILTFLFHFGIGIIVLIPTSILYIVEVDNNLLYLSNSIIVLFFLSLGVTGFGYLYNSFLNFFVIRLKFYKLFRFILVLGSVFSFLAAYMYVSLNTNITNIIIISDIVDFIINNSILPIVLVIIVCLSLIILGTFIFSKYYGIKPKIHENKHKKLQYNANSVLLTLVKKEFKNYLNSTMYLFNTIIGYIMILGSCIFLLFYKKEITGLAEIVYLFSTFSLAVTCTTNSSISLEGKNIWIIKSAPINPITILFSKVLMNLIMLFCTLTFSFLLLLLSNKIPVSTSILLYLLSLLISLFITIGGIMVNLILPKLDYKSEMEVVKQSASAVTSILFFIVFLSAPSFIYIFDIIKIELNFLIIINIIYLIIIDIILFLIFYKKGPILFKKL